MVLKIIQHYILLNLVNFFSMVVSDEERIKTKSKKEEQLKEKKGHIKLRQGFLWSLIDGTSFAAKRYWRGVTICYCIYIVYGFVLPLEVSFLVMLPTIISHWYYQLLVGDAGSDIQELIIKYLGEDRKSEDPKSYSKIIDKWIDTFERVHTRIRYSTRYAMMFLSYMPMLIFSILNPLLRYAYLIYVFDIDVFIFSVTGCLLMVVISAGAISLEFVHIGRYAVNKITRGSDVRLFSKPDEGDFIFFKVINKLCFRMPQMAVRAVWLMVSCLYEKSMELSSTISKINRDIKQFLDHKLSSVTGRKVYKEEIFRIEDIFANIQVPHKYKESLSDIMTELKRKESLKSSQLHRNDKCLSGPEGGGGSEFSKREDLEGIISTISPLFGQALKEACCL
ncbi:MAG: hypothetical protein VX737_06280 [Pseudomonadota bacterium]|nr:hypothetical protein [Pseudomonadota bacterium]